MYEVVLSRDAARTLEKAPPATKRRIIAALERVKAKPQRGKRLRGELEGLFSLRIGGIRAVYEVDAENKAVVFHAIGPRGDIYKKREIATASSGARSRGRPLWRGAEPKPRAGLSSGEPAGEPPHRLARAVALGTMA